MSENKSPADIGGEPAGPIDTDEHELAFWEWRVDAINQLLRPSIAGLVNTHEGRRAIEALGEDYEKLNYYERKLFSIQALLIEKGVFTADEFEAKLADIRKRVAAAEKAAE
jgi:hypothetical protein